MLLNIVALFATLCFSVASAQSSTTAAHSSSASGTTNSSATSTTSAAIQTHTCSVGAEGYNFSPNTIYANVGDIVEFRFYPLNHSVARASFKQPCIPYEDTGPGRIGFWSGFQPISLVLPDPPIFSLPINDTEPVFFYCSAPDACFQGMVGVINPNATWTYDVQFAWSQNATEEFSPLEYFPVEALPTRTTTATGATGTPTASASTAPSSSSSSSALSTGAIAGIAIGGAAVLVLAGALIYMCGRQKSFSDILRHTQRNTNGNDSYNAGHPSMSEANYPNLPKPGIASLMSGQYSNQGGRSGLGTETESYRSASPPVDERSAMISMNHAMHLGNGYPSPGTPGSAGFPSTGHNSYQPQEMDHNEALRSPPFLTQPIDPGPHELSNTETPTSTRPRPFSYSETPTEYSNDRNTDPQS